MSLSQAIMVPGLGGFTPADLSGLQIWHDARVSSSISTSTGVNQWSGVGGTSTDGTQGTGARQPANSGSINGFNAIDFDGSDDFLTHGTALDSIIEGADKQFSMGFVVECDDVSGNCIIYSKTDFTGNERAWFIRFNSSKIQFYIYANNNASYRIFQTSETYSDDTPYFIFFNYDGSVDTNNGLDRLTLYVNGAEQTVTISATAGALFDINDASPAAAMIGAHENGTGSGGNFDGGIGELFVYDELKTASEISQLNAYVAGWGISI